MNSPNKNASTPNSISGAAPCADEDSAEATLRLIAKLPAPQGLEDRVITGLKGAPRTARILDWPEMLHPTSSWMRGAAAAAIVFVVAGGGWGIYTHVQPTPPARVIVMPPRTGASGGFSNAGAMRTPQTLNGPMLTTPVPAPPVAPQPDTIKPVKKVRGQVVTVLPRRPKPVVGKAAAQPIASQAK